MGKKIILSFVIILILTSNVYANQGWGMSVMKCSQVLEKKGPKYWDEWILMTSQGLLSGLNVWHLRKFGHAKNITRAVVLKSLIQIKIILTMQLKKVILL